MQAELHSVEALRMSIARHIRELAEELLYWSEELGRLEDAGDIPLTAGATVIPLPRGGRRGVLRGVARTEDDAAG